MYRPSLVLLIALLACCVGQAQAVDRDRAYVSGNQFLTIDGAKCGFVKSVSGGAISAEVIQEPMGADYVVRKHIGQPKYEPFTMQIGFSMSKPVYEWIAESWTANQQRHSGSVVACDYQLAAKSERQFTHALITETTIPACDGSSKEPAYMTVTFAPESTQSVAPTGTDKVGGEYGRNEQKVWLPANFRLQIDGLDCSKVNKIDSFTVKQTVVTDDIGDARDYAKEPGKVEFPNLKITLSESDAASWVKWHDDFVVKGQNDESFEKDGTLVFLSPNRQTELATIEFYNLGIFRLVPEKVEANADAIKRITAELYCERMVFKLTGSVIGGASTPAEEEVLPPDGKGEWGKTYSMRKGEPLHFTLQKAEYSLEPVTIGKQFFAANADEKLLVLHFTVKNPGTTQRPARFDSLRVSATDQAMVSHPQEMAWGVEGSGALAAFPLEPNQTASLYAVVTVPAKGEPSAIVVKSGRDNDGPELPYDVTGHVAAMPAPFADPSDPTGATALEEVAAKRGVSYPYDFFSISVEDMAYTTASLGEFRRMPGERLFTCKLLVKNQSPAEHTLRYDMIKPILATGEGEPMTYKGMLLESTDRRVAQMLLPGKEMRVRIVFSVPKGATPSKLLMQEHKSRRYLYQVSG